MVSGTVIAAPGRAAVDGSAGWAPSARVADGWSHALIVAAPMPTVPTATLVPAAPAALIVAEAAPEVDLLWPSECERLARLNADGARPTAG